MPEGREEEVQSRRGWQGMGNSYAWQNFAVILGYDEKIMKFCRLKLTIKKCEKSEKV
jgi:hypothetical protein